MTGWCLTLRLLLGRPVPPVPDLPGRVYRCADELSTPEEIDAALRDGDVHALAGLASITSHHAARLIERQQAPGGASKSCQR